MQNNSVTCDYCGSEIPVHDGLSPSCFETRRDFCDQGCYINFCKQYPFPVRTEPLPLKGTPETTTAISDLEANLRAMTVERDQLRVENAVLMKQRDELAKSHELRIAMIDTALSQVDVLRTELFDNRKLRSDLVGDVAELRKERDALACRVEEQSLALKCVWFYYNDWNNEEDLPDWWPRKDGKCVTLAKTVEQALASTPDDSRSRVGELLRKYREGLEAAGRLQKNKYLDWSYAGGVNDCKHGRGEGIACPKCDAVLIERLLSQPLPAFAEREAQDRPACFPSPNLRPSAKSADPAAP